MNGYACLTWALFFLFSPLCRSETETFTVAGEIRFSRAGIIHVTLCSEVEFNSPRCKRFHLEIEADPETIPSQKVSFRFDDVPAGAYAIRSFQDVNGNRRLDIGIFGPKEPYGFFREAPKLMRAPRFEEVSFDLSASLFDVELILK